MRIVQTGNRLAAVRTALAGVALLVSGLCWAEVQLFTAVNLLETTVGEDGELERRLVDVTLAEPGDELRYTITFTNTGLVSVDPGIIVITNRIPESTTYVPDSAGGFHAQVLYSLDDGGAFIAFDALSEDALTEGRTIENPNSSGLDSFAQMLVQAIRWTYEASLDPGASSEVWFNLKLE